MSKQNLKYKIRQFQWFEMQTKVRQMVQQLIMPFQKRTMENALNINSLKSLTSQQSTKLQQLRLMVTNDPSNKNINIFKEIEKKFQEQSKIIMELKNLVSEQTKMVEKRFILHDERLKQNGEILLNNMQLKQRVNEQIRQQNENITQFRNSLQSMIIQLSGQIFKNQKQYTQNFKQLEQKYRLMEQKVSQFQEYIKINDQKIADINIKQTEFQKHDIHNDSEIIRIDKEIQTLSQNLAYTKKLTNYIYQLQQKLKQQDFSLNFLNPLITQAQISDTLFKILPPKLRKRLVIQQYQKYSKLNIEVLQNDYKKVRLKFKGLEMLEEVQKRNTRQIIDIKRKKLLAMGIDIDNVTYQQRQKYYREVCFDDQFIDEVQDHVKIKMQTQQKGDILKALGPEIQTYQKQLTAKIRIELDDSKKYVYQMHQQLQRIINENLQKIQSNTQSLELFQTEQILQNKKLLEIIQQRQKQIKQLNIEIKKINQNMFSFIQFCSLVNHLQIQDQLDKQSISLFGIKQTFNQTNQGKKIIQSEKKRIIDFNSQCFSCCGYPASTIAAFKMACLTYNPSQIIIQGKEYKREQILQISTKILQFIKNKLIDNPNIIPPQESYSQKQFVLQQERSESIKISKSKQLGRQTNNWTKIKRVNTSANTKIRNRTILKSANKRKEQLLNLSAIFSENKRKNLAFLN